MSFGGDNNIKELAKQLVIKNKDYIKKVLEQEGNSPKTIEKLKNEFISLASKDILETYQTSIEQKNSKIKQIEDEIRKFYDDLTTQISAERSIYGEQVIKHIEKYYELLQNEEKTFNENLVKINGIKEKLEYINKLLSDNEGQITDSLNHIKDLEKRYKTYINKTLDKLTEKLNNFGEDERQKIAEKIQKAYEKYLKDLKTRFDKLNNQLEEDYQNSKKELEKKLSKAFSEERFKVKKEKKELMRELLYFDGLTFLKVFLILGFVLLIIGLDYSLMREIIAEYFELDPYSDSPFRLFLYQYIVPFIFSGGIILGEIINDKVVKYHSKATYWVLKFFAYVAILGVIFSVVLTADGIVFEITQLPEVVIRLILFGISIPAAVILVERYINLQDILDFVKMTILLPFKLILVPFVYIMYLVENRKINLAKENAIQQVHESKINLAPNFKMEPFKVDLGKIIDIESFKEKNYNIIFHDDLDNNFKHILHSLNQVRNVLNDLDIVINKGNDLIKEKLKTIMELLTEVDVKLDGKIKNFEKQYMPYIESLKKQVREIGKDIEKEEETYKQLKQETIEGVLDGLNKNI